MGTLGQVDLGWQRKGAFLLQDGLIYNLFEAGWNLQAHRYRL